MTRVNELLAAQTKRHAQDPIIKDLGLDRWFTGQDLDQDVATLQAALTAAGVGRGAVLTVSLTNSAAYFAIDQAAWQIGIAVHPLSPTTPVSELVADQTDHGYQAMLVDAAMAEQLHGARFAQVAMPLLTYPSAVLVTLPATLTTAAIGDDPKEDDIALIMSTSGTTGKPKRVGLSQAIIYNAARHNAPSNRMTSQSVALIDMPLFHINSQVMVGLAMRYADAKLVVAPKFSASRFWAWVAANGVTWTAVVPTIVSILLLNEKANAAYQRLQDQVHLAYVRCSSFSLPEDQLVEFQNRFNTRILEGYGMTESSSQCTINPYDAPKIGSAGKPVGTEMAIRHSDGSFSAAPGTVGEIAIRGDHVITSYLDPHPHAFEAGWFLTGDLGEFDADGYLFVKGRTKEIISHGGEKVAPAHVENVLDELDFIAQLCVIGTPDKLYGEAVTAVVVSTTPGINEAAQREQLLAYGRAHLAKFEAPTQVVFMDDFPRNQTGKVLRPQLKQWIMEGQHEI
ncbi:AMP-binding protein [Lacticaseibacillus jixianensis]|uniref:AMP-binding protein n=1 Tax=Lacticaseibacillus jixianensis TaxID=2486012 RepID=A0ABW4BBB0_9LACO|nr:AMP-binding protein [Lacticaseibacillus jixianensis]